MNRVAMFERVKEFLENALVEKRVKTLHEITLKKNTTIPAGHTGDITFLRFNSHGEHSLYPQIAWDDIAEWHIKCKHPFPYVGTCPVKNKLDEFPVPVYWLVFADDNTLVEDYIETLIQLFHAHQNP